MRDLSGRVVKHPDREVRERIDFIFAVFLRVKSIHGLVRELAAGRLLVPRRERGRDEGAVVWRRPTAAALSSMLRNPVYAGTFVYGRTRFLPRVPGGPSRKHPLPPEQWQFMVPDKYPAYIDRDTFASIQAVLRDNYQEYTRRRSRGVARSGSALLQGLAHCGHCGRKMTVQYRAAARYLCSAHKSQGGGQECQRVPIAPVDAWVVRGFWEAWRRPSWTATMRPSPPSMSSAGSSGGPATSSSRGCGTRPVWPRSSTTWSTPRTGSSRPSWSGAGSKRCGPSVRRRKRHRPLRPRSNR